MEARQGLEAVAHLVQGGVLAIHLWLAEMAAEDFSISLETRKSFTVEEAEGARAERTGGHLQRVWEDKVVVEMAVPLL